MSMEINNSSIFEQFSEPNVTDLHITDRQSAWVRKRGDLIALNMSQEEFDVSAFLEQIQVKRDKLTAQLQAGGGQCELGAAWGPFRIRVHLYMASGIANIAIRKLASEIPDFHELGLPAGLEDILTQPDGLILVCGATGSGKSTTLASCIKKLNSSIQGNIITLEHPIEYLHESINSRVIQREVGEGSDCNTFANGVIASLREDPDVIMVGEVRDRETMMACLTGAQTGHLVLATLHTNSAAESIERILSFYSEDERPLAQSILSSTLRCVLAQRLIKGIKKPRVLAAELMIATPAIRSNIAKANIVSLEQELNIGSEFGQITMNRSLKDLYRKGEISRERALLSSSKRMELERMI